MTDAPNLLVVSAGVISPAGADDDSHIPGSWMQLGKPEQLKSPIALRAPFSAQRTVG
jgi:hypothetical protein